MVQSSSEKLRSAQEDYNDTRMKLVKKYSDEPDEEEMQSRRGSYPNILNCNGRALEEEFEIEGIRPIKFPSGLKLSPIEMDDEEVWICQNF